MKTIICLCILLLALFIIGCGAGDAGDSGISGGSNPTVNLPDTSYNNEAIAIIGGVISGKTSSFTAPYHVYPENNLSLKLIGENGFDIALPIFNKNTFLITIPRNNNHYILQIKNPVLQLPIFR